MLIVPPHIQSVHTEGIKSIKTVRYNKFVCLNSSTAAYWTLYSLELPTPKTVFSDISIVANSHRFTSVQTYCHLMNEAHMILRASLILAKWNFSEGNVSLILVRKMHDEDVKEAYRTSCALLGDHFVM